MDFKNIRESQDENSSELHFFFNHEERIRHAPKNVQDFYAGRGPQPPKGLLKSLWQTKANRFGLFAILVFCAFIYMYSALQEKSYQKAFQGIEATLSSFAYGDEIYTSVSIKKLPEKKAKKKAAPVAGNVTVYFSAIDNQGARVFEYDDKAYFAEKELIMKTHFSDYEIEYVKARVFFHNEEKELLAKPKR